MKIELSIKIRRQFILGWCILLITIISTSLTIIDLITNFEHLVNKTKVNDYNLHSFSIILLTIASLIYLALWVIAIINAISINRITNNSTLLIIFTVINFLGIAMLITTSVERKRLKSWDEKLIK